MVVCWNSGPTPVSALVHSSTLVTAGVYILIRQIIILNFNYIFNFFRKILLIVSIMTIFLARIAALGEKDIKIKEGKTKGQDLQGHG